MRDALKTMEAMDTNGHRIPFSMRVVTYNEQKDEGGDFLEMVNATLCGSDNKPLTHLQELNAEIEQKERKRKNPNHNINLTRNIRLQSGKIEKIHFHLITKFNGEDVF